MPAAQVSVGQEPVPVPIGQLQQDARLQCRVGGIDSDHVEDLKGAIFSGTLLVVYARRVPDGRLLVTDGHHTLEAHRQLGRAEVAVVVRDGTWGDAVRDAAGANAGRAKHRTAEDKQRAVRLVLEELPGLTDRAVAEIARVDHKTVARHRVQLGNSPTGPGASVRTGKDGKQYRRTAGRQLGNSPTGPAVATSPEEGSPTGPVSAANSRHPDANALAVALQRIEEGRQHVRQAIDELASAYRQVKQLTIKDDALCGFGREFRGLADAVGHPVVNEPRVNAINGDLVPAWEWPTVTTLLGDLRSVESLFDAAEQHAVRLTREPKPVA